MSNEFDDVEDNEAIKAAKAARASRKKVASNDSKGTNWKTVAGIGIGSAAVLAALIYANKTRKRNEDDED